MYYIFLAHKLDIFKLNCLLLVIPYSVHFRFFFSGKYFLLVSFIGKVSPSFTQEMVCKSRIINWLDCRKQLKPKKNEVVKMHKQNPFCVSKFWEHWTGRRVLCSQIFTKLIRHTIMAQIKIHQLVIIIGFYSFLFVNFLLRCF